LNDFIVPSMRYAIGRKQKRAKTSFRSDLGRKNSTSCVDA
jgi:hypothetical protein